MGKILQFRPRKVAADDLTYAYSIDVYHDSRGEFCDAWISGDASDSEIAEDLLRIVLDSGITYPFAYAIRVDDDGAVVCYAGDGETPERLIAARRLADMAFAKRLSEMRSSAPNPGDKEK